MVEILKQYPHFLKKDHQLKVSSFNRVRLAARRLLLSYPLYQYADLRGQDRVVIFGLSHQAQQLLLQLALNSHYRDFKAPHLIVCDKEATKRGQEFLSHNPGLKDSQICKIDWIDFDIHTQALYRPFLHRLEKQGKSAYDQNLTAILLCFEQDSQNITASLQLRIKTQQTRLAQAPIFVSMNQDLGAVSLSVDQTPHFEQVVQHFGQLEQTCSWQEIVETSSDKLAKFLQNAYDTRYGNGTKWSELSETFRDANRGAADHLGVKLACLGYWVPEDPSNWSEKVDLTTNLELMAILEHRRWYAERRLNGWQHGKTRDDHRKIHPCLIPYDQLPENEKEKDRTNIKDLQNFFSANCSHNDSSALAALRQQWLGKKTSAKVCRAVSIALLASEESRFENQNEFLKELFTKYHDEHITLMSSLQTALELDFVEIGLKQLKKQPGNLIIARPYPYDLQKEEGLETEMINHQLELSQQAEWVIDLVPAGKQLISLSQEERTLQRQRAVIYLLERADVVIMVGENQQWMRWRQGKEAIPAEWSSIPASLNREIPSELIMV